MSQEVKNRVIEIYQNFLNNTRDRHQRLVTLGAPPILIEHERRAMNEAKEAIIAFGGDPE